MEIIKYKFKVKHDEGSINISTVASTQQIAKEMIMAAEGCPERSIKFVSKTKL